MKTSADTVARYYDENTRAFLEHGQGGGEGAIHRAVWGEGIRTRSEAFHFVHQLILQEIDRCDGSKTRVLDLGCGVGGSLSYLVERRSLEAFGVTISERQLELARARPGLSVSKGDFCNDSLPGRIDLAFAIESFVHASDASAFFRNVASSLRPRGRLVLVDDFLSKGSRASPAVRRFIEGWHAHSLLFPHEVDAMAAGEGLVLLSDRDLTEHLELDRPRDRAIALFSAMLRPFTRRNLRIQALSGGNALRRCLKEGLVSYRARVWEKREVR